MRFTMETRSFPHMSLRLMAIVIPLALTACAAVGPEHEVPVVATPPNINVQIANANSTTTCASATGWTAVKTTTGEGTWSPFTADITVNQTSPNNYYCIKVTKATASANADDYQLNHHCGKPASGGNPAYFGHQASTFISYTQDQ